MYVISPSNSTKYLCPEICSRMSRTVLEIKQKNPFLIVITKPRKNFTNIRKKNHTTAALSCSRLPNQRSHVTLSRNLENKIYQKS